MESHRDIQSGKITQDELSSLNQLLTSELSELEAKLLKKKSKTKHMNLAAMHQGRMRELAERLTNISTSYFARIIPPDHSTDKLYQLLLANCQPYQFYSRAMNNLSSMVMHDILTRANADLMIMAAERWVYILKLSHEGNDFFTCAAIISALNLWPILRLNLDARLSANSIAIMQYIQGVVIRPKVLHEVQLQRHRNGERVVPVLSSLLHLLEAVKEQPECIDKSAYIKEQKEKYNGPYQEMQQRLFAVILDGVIKKAKVLLNKEHDDHLCDEYMPRLAYFKKHARDHYSWGKKFPMFYDNHDSHFQWMTELKKCFDDFLALNTAAMDKHDQDLWCEAVKIIKARETYSIQLRNFQLLLPSDLSRHNEALVLSIQSILKLLSDIDRAQTRVASPLASSSSTAGIPTSRRDSDRLVSASSDYTSTESHEERSEDQSITTTNAQRAHKLSRLRSVMTSVRDLSIFSRDDDHVSSEEQKNESLHEQGPSAPRMNTSKK